MLAKFRAQSCCCCCAGSGAVNSADSSNDGILASSSSSSPSQPTPPPLRLGSRSHGAVSQWLWWSLLQYSSRAATGTGSSSHAAVVVAVLCVQRLSLRASRCTALRCAPAGLAGSRGALSAIPCAQTGWLESVTPTLPFANTR